MTFKHCTSLQGPCDDSDAAPSCSGGMPHLDAADKNTGKQGGAHRYWTTQEAQVTSSWGGQGGLLGEGSV